MRTSGLVSACCAIVCISLMISIVAITADAQITGNLPRGSRFTVTITGQPNTPYYVWDAGTFSMSGAAGDQPPIVAGGTLNLQKDPPGGPYVIGQHTISSGGTIIDDVAPSTGAFSNTDYYCQITTDTNGQAIVEFLTSSNTATRHFAIKVEDQGGNPGALQVGANFYPRTPPPTTMTATPVTTVIPTPLPTVTSLPATVPATVVSVTETPSAVPSAPTKRAPVPLAIGVLAIVAGLAFAAKR